MLPKCSNMQIFWGFCPPLNTRNFPWTGRVFPSNLLCAIMARNHLPFFKLFSSFVHFCPNFQIFCSFLPFFFLSFFWKIACIPLLSRIGPPLRPPPTLFNKPPENCYFIEGIYPLFSNDAPIFHFRTLKNHWSLPFPINSLAVLNQNIFWEYCFLNISVWIISRYIKPPNSGGWVYENIKNLMRLGKHIYGSWKDLF